METVDCNLCGSAGFRVRHTIRMDDQSLRFYRYARRATPDLQGTYQIVECTSCHLHYVRDRLDADQLARVYGDNEVLGGNWRNCHQYLFQPNQPDELQDARTDSAQWSQLHLAWKFDLLRKHGIEEDASVLDVGCGRGNFVAGAVELGFDAYGLDRSTDRVAGAHRSPELRERIFDGVLEKLPTQLAGRRFDAITMWDVIEHLPDPRAALERLKPLCHEGTRVFLQTMSLDSTTYRLFGKRWYYVHPAIHLFYYSHATMTGLLDRAGYDLVGVENDASKPPTPARLARALLIGMANNLMFRVYGPHPGPWKLLKPLLRPLQRGMSDERMQRRIENLYPGFYAGRLRDVFVFVAAPHAASAREAIEVNAEPTAEIPADCSP